MKEKCEIRQFAGEVNGKDFSTLNDEQLTCFLRLAENGRRKGILVFPDIGFVQEFASQTAKPPAIVAIKVFDYCPSDEECDAFLLSQIGSMAVREMFQYPSSDMIDMEAMDDMVRRLCESAVRIKDASKAECSIQSAMNSFSHSLLLAKIENEQINKISGHLTDVLRRAVSRRLLN